MEEWFDELDRIIQDRKNEDIYYKEMQIEIESLISSNSSLDFVKQLLAKKIDRSDTIISLFCCNMLISEGANKIRLGELACIFDNKIAFSKAKRQITAVNRHC